MSSPVATAQAALTRMGTLLSILDREHRPSELYRALAGVRHEHQTAQELLEGLAAPVVASTPGAVRSGDPGTSKAAARAAATRSGSQRHAMLRALADRPNGATDYELIVGLSMAESSARTRRHELCQAGYATAARVPLSDPDPDGGNFRMVPVTRTRPSTGMECLVWEITALGRAALDRLDSGQLVLHLEPTLDTPVDRG